jgi:hypothetical protein
MLSKLIGGRSIAGVIVASGVGIALFVIFYNSAPPLQTHWLIGNLTLNPALSVSLSIITILLTAFLTRFQINRGTLSQAKGAHQLLLIPILACLTAQGSNYLQVSAACILAVSFIMMISLPPQGKRKDPVFHTGIVFGTSVVLVPSLIWALPVLLFVMMRVGPLAWRNWAALFLGAAFPIVVLFTSALIFDFHTDIWSEMTFQLPAKGASLDWPNLLLPTILVVGSALGFMAVYPPLVVHDKAMLQSFAIWILGGALLASVGLVNPNTAITAVAIPASVFVARWMEFVKRKWLVDLVYVALVVALII